MSSRLPYIFRPIYFRQEYYREIRGKNTDIVCINRHMCRI